MYAGDRARKDVLVEHGFRLPSARDNRPLTLRRVRADVRTRSIFVSATPGPYEQEHSEQVVEQVIRPTGLIDPGDLGPADQGPDRRSARRDQLRGSRAASGRW